jgi:sorting nexin-29
MCENYCGISLLNTAYKAFSVILFHRLQLIVETSIGNYQCGFTTGKSTSDHLHSVR